MKIRFTRILITCSLVAFLGAISKGQNATGLQNIIVEKYYISDKNDSISSSGLIPVGSVTYRIYADMKPGYKFQIAYGLSNHPLFFKTTTSFFNNEDRGGLFPTYTKIQAKSNTVMLDSWLTAGLACKDNFGVLKTEDNGVATVTNNEGILANNNPLAGIPLTEQDGMVSIPSGITITPTGSLGIGDLGNALLDGSANGKEFILNDGSWFNLDGITGLDSTNKVLIAQITTNGDFSFELNIQLRTPPDYRGTEKFVAHDAVADETQLSCLSYNSAAIHTGIEKPIEKNKGSNLISVYPNPATDGKCFLKIRTESKNPANKYKVCDLLGNLIFQKNIDASAGNYTDKIDLSAYPSGMYFIEVIIDGNRTVNKIVKR